MMLLWPCWMIFGVMAFCAACDVIEGLLDRLLVLTVAALWVAAVYTVYSAVHHPHGLVYLELTILRFT